MEISIKTTVAAGLPKGIITFKSTLFFISNTLQLENHF